MKMKTLTHDEHLYVRWDSYRRFVDFLVRFDYVPKEVLAMVDKQHDKYVASQKKKAMTPKKRK